MSDAEFILFTESMDRCWMQGRPEELRAFLADDVVMVSPDGKRRMEGVTPAIESYRQFTSHAQVSLFETRDHLVTQRGDAAIIEYAWRMIWTAAGTGYDETGREILVLARRGDQWRVVWRTQIPTRPAAG